MFVWGNALQCLSFQYRKHVKIGRGGMVITDDIDAVKWLRMARINGRHEGVSQADEQLEFCGWNMYMTPEQAARGLSLMEALPKEPHPDCGSSETYPDISKQKVFQ
jgi:dTDP-4-amino-4,6-dideoxygalactose transaminase